MAEKKNNEVQTIKIDKIRLLEVDKAIKDWFHNKCSTVINGRKVPVIFGSWERFVNMQGAKDDEKLNSLRDKNGMLKLPIISIVRNSVTPLPNRYSPSIIDGEPYLVFHKEIAHAKFDKRRVPFTPKWNAGDGVYETTAPVYEVHKLPFPSFVEIDYRVTFWCSYVKHANMFHNNIWKNFRPGDVEFNGYRFFAEINDSSDESNTDDFSTEERIIRHGFSVRIEAYLINTDEIKISRTISKIVMEEKILELDSFSSINDPAIDKAKSYSTAGSPAIRIVRVINPTLSDTSVYSVSGLTADSSSITTLTANSLSVNSITFDGTWENPILVGSKRLWLDSTNDALRVKTGTDPSNETDGSILSEGAFS